MLNSEAEHADTLFLRYLQGGSLEAPLPLTYGQLGFRSRQVASELRQRVSPGDRVLLLFPPGLHFSSAFLGTLMAGCVAVPAYTPDPNRMERTLTRLLAIIADSGATHVLTTESIANRASAFAAMAPSLSKLRWTAVDTLTGEPDPPGAFTPPAFEDVAYLQYTSGSTSRPRGVRITHGNILHNVGESRRLTVRSEPLRIASWMPVHHDFGLMLSIFLPLGQTTSCTLMSPLDFIRRPARWMETVAHFRCTYTGSPTFGYALAARKTPDRIASQLDLSSLSSCVVSAEHVRPQALAAFVDRFRPSGVGLHTFSAAYGLAEITVIATASAQAPVHTGFAPEALAIGEICEASDGTLLVGSGKPSEAQLRIVDADTSRPLPEGTIGSIWLHSDSVGDGYWNNPEASERTFGNQLPGDDRRWLSTGDLGFLYKGELFVTGRTLDRIIVAGVNLYPHDVEDAVENAHPACRPGNSAAFSWAVDGAEMLGVAVEIDERAQPDLTAIEGAIRAAVEEAVDARIGFLAFLPRNGLPKTSSGKRQRRQTALRLRDATLPAVAILHGNTTDIEELWQRFVGQGVGDFLERGGQSLDLIHLSEALEEQYGVEVPFQLLLENPTLEGVRIALESSVTLPSKSRSGRLSGPTTRVQQRMAYLCELAGPAYNVVIGVNLAGELDPDRLSQAVTAVLHAHHSLRTTWRRQGTELLQTITNTTAELQTFDLRGAPVTVQKNRIKALLSPSFQLAEGPPVRVALFQIHDAQWRMIWVWPHVAIDGWSVDLVLRDLWRAYGGAALEEPRRTMIDVALEELPPDADALAFHCRALEAADPTQLPGDPNLPPRPPYSGGDVEIELPQPGLQRLMELGHQEGCTPYQTMLAVFLLAVHRWTDRDDIVIGLPMSTRSGSRDGVGCFIETRVLRSQLNHTTTFRDHLQTVRGAVFNLIDKPVPLADLVRALRPKHDADSPLFHLLFNHITRAVPSVSTPFSTTEIVLERGSSQLDLSCHFFQRDKNQLVLEYSAERFERTTIERLGAHLVELLHQLSTQPDQPVHDVPFLPTAEKARIRQALTGSVLPSVPANLLQPVLAHMSQSPESIALVEEGRKVSYGALKLRAFQLAGRLEALSIGTGDVVGIELPRGVDNVAAQLAILMVGAIILPLSPGLPRERRGFFLETSELSAAFTHSEVRATFPCPSIVVDEGSPEALKKLASIQPKQPAFLLFTSGSTGTPKGVWVSHEGLANRLAAGAERIPTTPTEIYVQKTSSMFGDALTEVFMPLWAGASAVIAKEATVHHPRRFLQLLEEHHVTRMLAVPSLLGALHDVGLNDRLPALRSCISSGEALSKELTAALQEALPHVTFWNLYGSSETSCDVTAQQLSSGPVPIGRPLSNVRLQVVDRHLHPRPLGFPGQLLVGGVQVSPGYLNPHPASPSPFFTEEGVRWFQTGDDARLLPTGELLCLGRHDEQVKIRGARVDLVEVTARLKALPGIEDATVRSVNGELTAYIVSAHPPKQSQLRRDLQDALPSHALPTRLVHLDKLPRLPSGKLDKSALPAPGATAERPDLLPTTPMEVLVASIWKKLLNVESVHRDDDFFDLGGHSLLAMEVLSRLEETLKRPLSPRLVLRTTTVRELASLLEDRPQEHPHTHRMQREGAHPPLFMIHGVAGTTARLRSMADHFHGHRQMIGLDSSALNGGSTPSRDVRELAREYASRVLLEQAAGPIFVGGYSFGGLLAFETAQELERRGRTVGLCVLIDSRPPASRRRRDRIRQRAAFTRMRTAVKVHRLQQRLRGRSDARLAPLLAIKDACFSAWANYRPDPWDGPVLWLKTTDPGSLPMGDWRPIASNLTIVPIGGEHATCIRDPYVASLAETILRALDETPRHT